MQQLCEECCQWKNPPFVEVYPDYTKHGVASLDGAPLRVCGNCVVGRCVPASRPSTSKWNFGRVVAFSYPLFALFFDDGLNPEWVALEPNPMDGYLNSLDSQEENPEDEHLQSPISLSSSRGFHTPPPPPRQPPFAWHSRAPPVSPFEHSSRSPYVNVPEPIPAASYAAPTESTSTPVSQSRGVGQQNQYEDIGSPPRSASAQEATKLVHKSSPRLWSVQEDRALLRAIQTLMDSSGSSASTNVKWPDVARLVPGRTGKQCRERYFNHLAPTVVSAQWTPVEDAIVCRLYRRVGPGWASISKLLPGRSDNNVKNRFHYLRRQLEKVATSRLTGTETGDASDKIIRDRIHKALVANGTSNDDIAALVGDVLTRMLRTGGRLLAPIDLYGSYFGPFTAPRPNDGVSCKRCALLVPAVQTGSEVCSKTGWCTACSGTMVFLSDALLRLEHELQSSRDPIVTDVQSVDEQ